MRLALLRPLLALVLAATFGVRTMAPELMRGCGPGTGVAHHDGEAGPQGHHHASHQLDRCECVGHSVKVVFSTPPVRTALAVPVVPFAPAHPGPEPLLRRAAADHLLPFAQAPPATPLA